MPKKLEGVIRGSLIASFFVPLVLMPSTFIFPFIVPKILIFRSLALIMLGSYILLLCCDWQRYRPRLSPLTSAVLLFFLSFSISTFTGVDWYRSFWDNHERMLGLFTITHYVLYYLIITGVVREWPEWQRYLRAFLLAGSVVMLVGFMQKINPEFLLNQGGSRVIATLGNAIYYGSYGVFLAFMAALVYFKETNPLWRKVAVAEGVMAIVGLFFSGTRGAFLGLALGAGVTYLIYFFQLRGEAHRLARRIMGSLMIAGMLIALVLFAFRHTPVVQGIPLVGSVLNISLTTGSAGTRLLAWQTAVDAWRERPVFGWGPNNFYHAFNQYYRPEMLEFGYGETWFDNAHNSIVNTLAVQGVIGVMAYLAVFVVAGGMLWQAYRRDMIDRHTMNIGSGFLVAHLVQSIFVFENPTSYLFFFFFLAFANSICLNHQASASRSGRISNGLVTTVAVVVLLLIYSTNVNPARANMATLNTIRDIGQGLPAVARYRQALLIPSPHIDDIRNDLARAAGQVLPEYVKAKRVNEANELFDIAYQGLLDNTRLHPFDVRVYIEFSQLAQQGASLKQDPALVGEAEQLLTTGLTLSPKRQQIQFLLAALKMRLNKFDEAVELLQTAIDNDPKVGESWWRLALLYRDAGRPEQARAVIAEAKKRGAYFDQNGQGVVQQIIGLTSSS